MLEETFLTQTEREAALFLNQSVFTPINSGGANPSIFQRWMGGLFGNSPSQPNQPPSTNSPSTPAQPQTLTQRIEEFFRGIARGTTPSLPGPLQAVQNWAERFAWFILAVILLAVGFYALSRR